SLTRSHRSGALAPRMKAHLRIFNRCTKISAPSFRNSRFNSKESTRKLAAIHRYGGRFPTCHSCPTTRAATNSLQIQRLQFTSVHLRSDTSAQVGVDVGVLHGPPYVQTTSLEIRLALFVLAHRGSRAQANFTVAQHVFYVFPGRYFDNT